MRAPNDKRKDGIQSISIYADINGNTWSGRALVRNNNILTVLKCNKQPSAMAVYSYLITA